jgi:hypothetical protein
LEHHRILAVLKGLSVKLGLGGKRGRKIELRERKKVIALIEEACSNGARLFKACEVVGISVRTVQRYRQHGTIKADGRKAAAAERIPPNRLNKDE